MSEGRISRQTAKCCVYTTLIGGYEPLKEQPVAARSSIPFICLTDDPELTSTTWQIRHVLPVLAMDPIRSQRRLKILPQLSLPDFDYSLYIDNSVELTRPPEEVFERYFGANSFCVPSHSFRDTVLDEFLEVAHSALDDHGRIFEQLNHYTIDSPEVLEERPFWSAIMLRDHADPTVRTMQDIWLTHVQRYSRRDQLSMNVAFRQAGLSPAVMAIDNHASWFHTWPHLDGRKPQNGPRPPFVSLSTPGALIRRLERDIAEETRRHGVEMAEAARGSEAALAGERKLQAEALAEQAQLHAIALARLEEDSAARIAAATEERECAVRELAALREAKAGLPRKPPLTALRRIVGRYPPLAAAARIALRSLRRLRG